MTYALPYQELESSAVRREQEDAARYALARLRVMNWVSRLPRTAQSSRQEPVRVTVSPGLASQLAGEAPRHDYAIGVVQVLLREKGAVYLPDLVSALYASASLPGSRRHS